jgi:hypothetical protein
LKILSEKESEARLSSEMLPLHFCSDLTALLRVVETRQAARMLSAIHGKSNRKSVAETSARLDPGHLPESLRE